MTSWTRTRNERAVRAKALALALLLTGHLVVPGFGSGLFLGRDGSGIASAATRKDEARARKEVMRARKAFDLARFQEALDAYSKAYAIDPRAPTLFNIAQCHRQLEDYDRAAFFYRRYLSYYPAGTAPNQKVVESLIAEVEQQKKDAELAKKAAEDAEKRRLAAAARLSPSATPGSGEGGAQDGLTNETLVAQTPNASESGGESIFKKWWFWTGVGVVAAAAGTAAYVATSPQAPPTTLGTADLR